MHDENDVKPSKLPSWRYTERHPTCIMQFVGPFPTALALDRDPRIIDGMLSDLKALIPCQLALICSAAADSRGIAMNCLGVWHERAAACVQGPQSES